MKTIGYILSIPVGILAGMSGSLEVGLYIAVISFVAGLFIAEGSE